MKTDCVFLEAEEITAWGYYCRATGRYNEEIVCEGCKLYEKEDKHE